MGQKRKFVESQCKNKSVIGGSVLKIKHDGGDVPWRKDGPVDLPTEHELASVQMVNLNPAHSSKLGRKENKRHRVRDDIIIEIRLSLTRSHAVSPLSQIWVCLYFHFLILIFFCRIRFQSS